ncbi:metallophosphatase family protein [Paenibacillus thiaminolyticus]|uniref:metallophosphoesterase family protein n=1 Tax=Paenibacillus thiaminolyticus TaxID=49283 RepID=UPI0023502B6E|nr:YfcE family phosphodiesterase [Paenibacillus thiaminolyticus]WCR28768.1 metallophosphatase family protein [Paenibacillus thiaminolyticus]
MKIAAVYDIHGNYHALKSVFHELEEEDVEKVIIGGDLAWGPQPREVMDFLYSQKEKFIFIMGNSDREMYEYYLNPKHPEDFVDEMNCWCVEQLTKEQLEWIVSFRKFYEIEGKLFVHGSPRSDTESIRVDTPESEVYEMIKGIEQDKMICGHTHIQFVREIYDKQIINAGSVGLQSRAKGACWLLLNDEEIQLKVTKYDFQKAAHSILAGECPYKENFAEHILNPPYEGP